MILASDAIAVLGHEQQGVPPDALGFLDTVVEIPWRVQIGGPAVTVADKLPG
ncbi:hypothetical protein [Amycolatopsis sp. cmx-4-54]|uniref:hypothetical protein n=1 Tax=Amycolatopsis sp. cmx-4-54 TaxID=2790936 RepID=UPI00397A05C6